MIRESQSDQFISSNCTVLESNGPYAYSSTKYVCDLLVSVSCDARKRDAYHLFHTIATSATCSLYGTSCHYDISGSCSGPCWYVPEIDEVHTSTSSGPFEVGIIILILSVFLFCCGLIGTLHAVAPKKNDPQI
jgi:hypothetical protein